MPNIAEFLKKATETLQQSGIAEPRLEAHSLLAFVLQKDKTFLFAHPEYQLTEVEENWFENVIKARANREPFQYITGKQEFYGLDFKVNSDVLIPRPETEIIVENAIEILQNLENPRFCEIGVGSGCISVSILHNVPNATATGADISEKALLIARQNAETHNVLERLGLQISDVFDLVPPQKFELIVSNPPYISAAEFAELQPEVHDYEPYFALTDHKDGYLIIEKIVATSPNFLHPNGFLLMEIGFGQAETVRQMFADEIWQSVEFLRDLQGIERTVKAQIKSSEAFPINN